MREADGEPMTLAALVCSYGPPAEWRPRAARAAASCQLAGFDVVIESHVNDMTLAEVRNATAEGVDADWIVFVDADDTVAPGFADEARYQIDVWQTGVMLTPRVEYVGRGGVVVTPAKHWERVDPIDGNWMVIGTVIERQVFLDVGGFREWPMYEDWCLWARMQQRGVIPVELDATYVAQVNPGSRNRGPGRRERTYWHQAIGHDLWPDRYAPLTDAERRNRRCSKIRRVA